MKPVKTGVTFAVTGMLFYALCALIWFVFPEPFMQFMNSLFHGMDFHRLQSEPATLGGTIYCRRHPRHVGVPGSHVLFVAEPRVREREARPAGSQALPST